MNSLREAVASGEQGSSTTPTLPPSSDLASSIGPAQEERRSRPDASGDCCLSWAGPHDAERSGGGGGNPCCDVPGSPGAAGALENYANKSSPPASGAFSEARSEARKRRYMGRAALWRASRLRRCRMCGRKAHSADGRVGVRSSGGVAGFAGLVTCGSVWACPVCAAKILARRALEIGTAVAAATAEGTPVAFATFTMRHHKGQALAELWDALGFAWSKRTVNGKYWQAARTEFGVLGYVRVVEVTHGRNGWHVHVHALIFGEGLTTGNIDRLCRPMWERWSRGLQAKGLDAPLPIGSEWHVLDGDLTGTAIGEYLAKGMEAAGSIGAELTQTQSKIARAVNSTYTTWQLLEDGPVNGEVAGLRAWWEWEQASKGRRQIAWSQGLRERFGVGRELADEEIAAEELGSADDTLVWITRRGWAEMVKRPALIPQVLDVAEHQGAEGLSRWLAANGVEHDRR